MPDSPPSAYTSDTIELLRNRASVRRYRSDPVPEAMVEAILKAAFRAPTSSNIQSYSVIVVRDREILRQLASITSNQRHVAEAPVFLAFCADLTRIAHALDRRGHSIADNNLETGLVASIDAALVGMCASLAADSLGLRGVMIGAMRNDASAAARILGLPDRVYCVFGLCLGFPDEAPVQKPRMDYAGMVHYERYGSQRGAAGLERHLAAYDTVLAKHYRATGRATTDDSWTHDMDKKFHPWLRDKLREQLKERGFDFR